MSDIETYTEVQAVDFKNHVNLYQVFSLGGAVCLAWTVFLRPLFAFKVKR